MRRVLVIGSGGAGKTTFARALAERTGLPLVHLDEAYWRPGWSKPESAEWEATVERLVAEPEWIMDGNYGGTMERRIEACDTVIFLDVPRTVCIARVVRRWLTNRGTTRPGMTPDCPERLTLEFLGWIWSYPRRRRPGILKRLQSLRADQRAHVLRGSRDVELFFEELTL